MLWAFRCIVFARKWKNSSKNNLGLSELGGTKGIVTPHPTPNQFWPKYKSEQIRTKQSITSVTLQNFRQEIEKFVKE